MTLRSAEAHYSREAQIAYATARQVDTYWRRVTPGDIDAWRDALVPVVRVVAAGQVVAAQQAEGYVARALTEQGVDVAPLARVNPAGFAGMPNAAVPVDALLDRPRILAKMYIGDGMAPRQALAVAGQRLQTYTLSLTQDAGRQAVSAGITARPKVGWRRMVNLPSCERCAVLAGKWFRHNQGFQRHPRCDCVHIPAVEDSPSSIGTDPDALFASGQVRGLREAETKAIANGADPIAVVNARRGSSGMTTTESTTRRGRAARGRLTPEGIYAQAGEDRERALELLEQHGYVRR